MSRGVESRPKGGPRASKVAPAAVALRLPSDVRLFVSSRGFGRLCAANPELRLERTAKGAIEAMPPASGGTGARNGRLTAQVVLWSIEDRTGTAFDSSVGFTLPSGAVRSPDASWILNDRWLAQPPKLREIGFSPICPDFVAELASPGDDRNQLRAKMEEYIAQGARLGWLIDPRDATVRVYRLDRPVETLSKPPTLSGEDVLPGFVLDLKGILFD